MNNAVSVVIPCYNAEATVAEAIESALAQTWPDIEIVVVDDGSTDRSADILRGFKDRIRTDFGPNCGASVARDKGTMLARGEYIQYLDADDLLTPEAVASRLDALRETEADVAFADWQRFSSAPDGSRLLGQLVALRMQDLAPDPELACATTFWAPPAALLYRRCIVDAIGGWNERLPVIQDARFLFDAARQKARFVHVPGVSAFYRDSGASLSRGDEGRFMLDVYRNAIEIQSLWQTEGPLTRPRKMAIAGIFDMTARTFFHLGMPEFDDAVTRFKQVSDRRFGYPEIAHAISAIAGRDFALAAAKFLAQMARLPRAWR